MSKRTELTLTDISLHSVSLPSVRVRLTPPRGPSAEVPLGLTPLVVGTGPECDLLVDDQRVSRRHLEIRLTEEGVQVRDLGSKNGTFVGNVRVVEVFIAPGAKIEIGGSKLQIQVAGDRSVVPLSPSARFGGALGGSVSMRALFAKLERASATEETILLLGESGTGKEVLAEAIHKASSRRDRPFIVFDCSAVAPALLDDALFGHERGAFTGADKPQAGLLEQVESGTLFIDEIGELPFELQPKLLRALESRQMKRLGDSRVRRFEGRVVAATHRDLRAQVAAGTFRQDLYYRLAVVEVRVPPLRDRREDIPLLVEHFLQNARPPRSVDDLPPNAMELLQAYAWPGNVRELRNVIARLLIFNEEALEALTEEPRAAGGPGAPEGASLERLLSLPFSEARSIVVERFVQAYLSARLRECGGNRSKVAEVMGISRQSVHNLIRKYGLDSSEP
jgi:DNA-binding NtrC family response regulator